VFLNQTETNHELVWPSYNRIPNTIPKDQGITTNGMISYFLFWIIQLPLLLIPPTRLRYLFMVKLVAAPVTALATLGWIVHKAGGSGELFNIPERVHGSTRAYLWLSSMSAVTGSWATLACNIPDFSRYARSSKGQYIQLPFLPCVFTICGVMGIITTSASYVVYGKYYWNPLDIVSMWLDNKGGRAAAFFAALSWYIAQVGTNITANSISAANDLTVLFPKYVNIKRGCIIAAVVGGWVIVPWKILSSATTFLAFMGGYAVFLAPMAGIIASDYWLVKRQHIDVPALYDPNGRYRYNKVGINPRAFLAFFLSVGPLLPGLAYSINPKGTHISVGTKHLYTFDWLFGFVTSIVIYTGLSYVWKPTEALVPHTIYGVPPVGDEEEAYEEKYDENVLRKGSLTGNPKSFANVGGIDDIASTLKFRKSMEETARSSIEIRKASRASQGGQGPREPGTVPEHLHGVDEKVLAEKL
jgi:NCS1 family nucleobase:cation symporter-1